VLNKRKIRDILLSFPLTRELSFFLFQKKIYKKIIDRKIITFLKSERKNKMIIDNLIVSLTSFPERIDEVKYVIYSLCNQTVLPNKIILWLAESQFPNKEKDLPDELLIFKKFGLFINWCDDIRSYKKLIPTLEQFPAQYIATADDDIYYRKKWLEKLWSEHLKHPEDLVCHYVNQILFNDKGILPYSKWKMCIKNRKVGSDLFCCSGGGILFHKKYLHKDINKRELFQNLAPYADDIWFYFMAILNGTIIRQVKNPYNKVISINPYREYDLENKDAFKLGAINVDGGYNDKQFNNIAGHYGFDIFSFVSMR